MTPPVLPGSEGGGVTLKEAHRGCVGAQKTEPRLVHPRGNEDAAQTGTASVRAWQEVARLDVTYNPAAPAEGAAIGGAEIAMQRILQGVELPPALYVVRIEHFSPNEGGGASAGAVGFTKWAVLN